MLVDVPDEETAEILGAQLTTWGAPTWPPTPPSARSAPGNPGRSSTSRFGGLIAGAPVMTVPLRSGSASPSLRAGAAAVAS